MNKTCNWSYPFKRLTSRFSNKQQVEERRSLRPRGHFSGQIVSTQRGSAAATANRTSPTTVGRRQCISGPILVATGLMKAPASKSGLRVTANGSRMGDAARSAKLLLNVGGMQNRLIAPNSQTSEEPNFESKNPRRWMEEANYDLYGALFPAFIVCAMWRHYLVILAQLQNRFPIAVPFAVSGGGVASRRRRTGDASCLFIARESQK